jgi:pilus assembly protein CpaE
LFQHLREPDLQAVSRLLHPRQFRAGQVFVKEGAAGDAMFILTAGRVKVFTMDPFGREKVLAFLGPGQFLGETALLTGQARSASAEAVSHVRVFELRKDDLDVLLYRNPSVMQAMLQVIAGRQVETGARVAQRVMGASGALGKVTVVYSPGGGTGTSTIATNLSVALAQLRPESTVLVDLDVEGGQVEILLGLTPRSGLASVSPAAFRAADESVLGYYLTVHEPSSLRVLLGTTNLADAGLVTEEHVAVALDTLRRYFAHVIVDTRGDFGDCAITALQRADRVLVVATPALTVLHDVRECHRIFTQLLGLKEERIQYVLNHPFPYAGVGVEGVALALGGKEAFSLPCGGAAPSEAALVGVPLVMEAPSNPMSQALTELAADLDREVRESLALAA